jgi:hypothetical protein
MPLQAAAAVAAALISFAADGDRITLTLDRGAAEVAWVNDGAFRYRRTLDGPLPEARPPKHDPVAIQIHETPDRLLISSRLIEVSVSKKLLLIGARAIGGDALMQDGGPPQVVAGGVQWSRVSPAGPFYGLGPRAEPELDLRGRVIETDHPFLVSSAGYGEYHPGGGTFHFDFRAANTYRIVAPRIDYYFYYGPRFKQIFDHHHEVRPASTEWKANDAAPGTWNGLRDSLLRLVHAAMSAELDPSFDLKPFRDAPEDLAIRARQIGSLVPKVVTGRAGLSGFRQQLDTFFTSYVPDADFHGYPMWHALPFQFPSDPECGRHADEFMLGDEMLIAPIYDAGGKRTVYLPQGTWTNLETNEAIPGRRTITVETKALPVFARNGAIVPLDSESGMALHYFPTLPAEFFLLEHDIEQYSQVHAAPAGDEMRLEIESAKPREYEWVVHHVEAPSWVGFGDRQFRRAEGPKPMSDGMWFYDGPQRNLYIRVSAKAGEDVIVNLKF